MLTVLVRIPVKMVRVLHMNGHLRPWNLQTAIAHTVLISVDFSAGSVVFDGKMHDYSLGKRVYESYHLEIGGLISLHSAKTYF